MQLPESPQHQRWRKARQAASERIEQLRGELRAQLQQADQLAGLEHTDSDSWFTTGKQLQEACWRLGFAIHCLYEWPEPKDATADIDPGDREGVPMAERALRRGRRNITLWNPT